MNCFRNAPFLAVVLLALSLSACGSEDEQPEAVNSVLSGQLTVDPEVDPVADYRDFEVLVYQQTESGLDTLGYAMTDSSGIFSMDIAAPERGLYPLAISRRGTILTTANLVVADEDSATVRAIFPVPENRPLLIRSRENGGWMAYQNTRAQYTLAVSRMEQAGELTPERVAQTMGQTVNMLWGLQDQYENTLGAELAAAESVIMLEGANDSLLLERARTIEPDNLNYVGVAQAARRVETRLSGPEAGLAILEEFTEKAANAPAETRLNLDAERVLALIQNDQREEAMEAAAQLAEDYPDTEGAAWANRITYDLQHMMPGMQAPHFSVTSLDDRTLMADSLQGKYVLLEFYDPLDETYQSEVPIRNATYEAGHDLGLEIVSVSVEPDSVVNQAFYEAYDLQGTRVIASGGINSPIVKNYNVFALPKRVLINREGEIVRVYEGAYMPMLMNEIVTLLATEEQPA